MPRIAEKRSASTSRSFLSLFSSSPRPAGLSERAAQGVAFFVGLSELHAHFLVAYNFVGAHVDELGAATLQLLQPRGESAAFPVGVAPETAPAELHIGVVGTHDPLGLLE